MSPSEFDLRAALHDGEGGELNVDQVIQHARARVTQRRVRLLSGAAIVALVAGVATGGALLAGAGNGSHQNSANEQGAETSARSAAGGQGAKHRTPVEAGGAAALSTAVPGPANAPVLQGTAGATSCPRRPPPALPGGRSPEQLGTAGPLFSKPVASVVVCGYGSTVTRVSAPNRNPARLELHDGAATRLAASLENAAKVKPRVMCPDYRTADAQQIAIIGITADGKQAGIVTTTIGLPACDVEVTNGTAIRYNWTPPADIARQLAALNPVGVVVSPGPSSTTK